MLLAKYGYIIVIPLLRFDRTLRADIPASCIMRVTSKANTFFLIYRRNFQKNGIKTLQLLLTFDIKVCLHKKLYRENSLEFFFKFMKLTNTLDYMQSCDFGYFYISRYYTLRA